MTLKEFMESLLFHGTLATIDGDLRPGGFDGVFWTAESPSVAQTYIPASATMISYVKPYDLDKPVMPEDDAVADSVCKQMGYEYEIRSRGYDGRPSSWVWKGSSSSPKMRDVVNYLENTLGYNFEGENFIRIKARFKGGSYTLLPADHKSTGRLFMLMNRGDLKIFDYSVNSSDLTDPQYNHLGVFRALEQKGYDGIKISDYTLTRSQGSVEHTSIGLFPSGLKKVKHMDIPASNFEWREDAKGKDLVHETQEFKEFHRDQVKKAIEQGKEVPPEVVKEYFDTEIN